MKRALGGAVAVMLALAGAAMAEPWNKSVDANLTLTQNAYSDSWIGGEVGSLSWTFSSNSLFEKQINPKVVTRNTLKLFFGQTHSQNRETKHWSAPVTSSDLIDFETVFRFTLGMVVDPYASARVETRFRDDRQRENTRYVNPVLFTESFGIAKQLVKQGKREWILRLGGGVRENLDRDMIPCEGCAKISTTTKDGGALFVSDFTSPLSDTTITLASKLSVYKAFYFSEAEKLEGTPRANFWKSPDVNWETWFSAAVTKHVMVSLYVQLLYDKEVALAGRLRQNLSLGLTYKLL